MHVIRKEVHNNLKKLNVASFVYYMASKKCLSKRTLKSIDNETYESKTFANWLMILRVKFSQITRHT